MNEIEDEKLLIFGWITTVFGLPPKANPDKYNELTEKLHKLFSDLIKQSQQELIEKIQGLMPKDRKLVEPVTKRKVSFGEKVGIDLEADTKGSLVFIQNNGYNQAVSEVTTILKQVREGL